MTLCSSKPDGFSDLIPSGFDKSKTDVFSRLTALRFTLGECCDSVRPGLDLGPDRVVRVGLERDPVTAEREVIQLAVWVVAPEGCTEGLGLGVPHCGPAVCCGEGGACEQCSGPGVEPGDGVEPAGVVAYGRCVYVLVNDPGRVALPDLFHGVMGNPGSHILYTPERVAGDDRLDDRVEGRHVRDRAREFTNRILGLAVLYEICHWFSWLLPSGPWAVYILCFSKLSLD